MAFEYLQSLIIHLIIFKKSYGKKIHMFKKHVHSYKYLVKRQVIFFLYLITIKLEWIPLDMPYKVLQHQSKIFEEKKNYCQRKNNREKIP